MRHEFESANNYGVRAVCYCQREPVYRSPEGAKPDEVVLDHEPMAEAISKDHEEQFNHVVYMVHEGPFYQTIL